MSLPFSIHEHMRQARFHGSGDKWAPTGTYKEYPRMPRVELPLPAPLTTSLGEVLAKRSSHDPSGTTLDIKTISTLFGHALRIREDGKRPYPSGGALYPIETYFVACDVENIPRAALHYHPKSHSLENLWDLPKDFSPRDIYEKAESVSGLIVLTAIWNRSEKKYGDFSYYLGMLESGHVAQNILLTATALKIKATPVGGFEGQTLEDVLDLDRNIEQVVYVIVV